MREKFQLGSDSHPHQISGFYSRVPPSAFQQRSERESRESLFSLSLLNLLILFLPFYEIVGD